MQMHVSRKTGRWLSVRIDDFEKWQASLLEESARRLGAVLAPGGRVYRWGFAGSPAMFRGSSGMPTRRHRSRSARKSSP